VCSSDLDRRAIRRRLRIEAKPLVDY